MYKVRVDIIVGGGGNNVCDVQFYSQMLKVKPEIILELPSKWYVVGKSNSL